MDARPARIGRSIVYVESADVPVDTSQAPPVGEFGTSKTGSKMEDAYAELKAILQDVSSDLGAAIAQSGAPGLSSVSVELALSFTGEANVWVLKAGGEGSVKATLTWDLTQT